MSDLPEIDGYVTTAKAIETVVKLHDEIERLQAVVDAARVAVRGLRIELGEIGIEANFGQLTAALRALDGEP